MYFNYPPPAPKSLWAVLLVFSAFAPANAVGQSLDFRGEYVGPRGCYYDIKGVGVMQSPGQYSEGYHLSSENPIWFNFDNDGYIDAYRSSELWHGDATYLYEAGTDKENYQWLANYALLAVDINNDGRLDLKTGISECPESAMMFVRGKWYPARMELISMEEYLGEQKELVLHSGHTLGSGVSFVGSGSNAETKTGTLAIDFNADGYTDLVDAGSGLIYQNLGDGRYVLNEVGGKLTFRDFNNDGLADYVLFDSENKKTSLFLSQPDGSWKEKSILSGLYSDEDVYCYDFDKDGDVDVLITLSYYVDDHSNGSSFVLLLENEGDGDFRQHEIPLDGAVYFRQCVDINGDGRYELVAQKVRDGEDARCGQTDLVYYTIDGMSVADSPVCLKEKAGDADRTYTYLLADIDNSGFMHVLYGKNADAIPGAVANTAPTSPEMPLCVYDVAKGTLRVEWGEGSDAEVSTTDLTYELRIGTAEDKGDMLFAHALPDGRRRNLLEGNCGYIRSRTLDVRSWPAGRYYVSVQTVDPGCLGSKFSPYAIFEKKDPAADFLLSCEEYYFGVGDTCTVVLLGGIEPGCTYEWSWGDATIISQSADGSEYKIKFATGGEKHISLQAMAADGTSCRVEHRLDVLAGNVREHNFGENNLYSVNAAMDIDEDGRTEIFASVGMDGAKFLEGDDKAQYKSVQKIWNTNLPFSAGMPVDINRDGMADFASYNYNKVYFLVNEDDRQMTLSESALNVNIQSSLSWYDFNNDGLLEPSGYRNMGDYVTFERLDDNNATVFVDYDRDGLIDFLVGSRYKNDDGNNAFRWKLYRNNGDFTFTPDDVEFALDYSTVSVEDIDGDGKWDLIGSNYSSSGIAGTYYASHIAILWGNGETTIIPAEDGIAFGALQTTMDVDNNGCIDLIVGTSNGRTRTICFNRNRSYRMEYIGMNFIIGADYLLTDGRPANGENVFPIVDNSAPAAPTHLRSSQNEKFVTIEWNHSIDKETPAAQMRYNIGIRHKGAVGEGAYFISPLNSMKDGVHVPSPLTLLSGNKIVIPVQNIPAGDYEVQVQGVDRRLLESPFSAVYNLTVREKTLIEMPTSAGVGRKVLVKVVDNSGQTADFGIDSSAEKNADGSYTVVWSSEGAKTIRLGSSVSQEIYVYPLPKGAFALPESVKTGAKVTIEGENMMQCSWSYSFNRGDLKPVGENAEVSVSAIDDNHAVAVFNKVGQYELFHNVADDFNSESYSATTMVERINPCPELSIVDIDPESGKYRLTWSVDNLPTGSQSMSVYKETSRYDEYELLANVPLTETSYVDASSMPDYSTSRYRIACVLPYGETMGSTAHQPIHVMINKGLGDTWNLVWTKYEGATIDSYRILGGTSADNLAVVAEVSGHLSSYSDLDASSDMRYYAVEVIPAMVASAAGKTTSRAAAVTVSRSNVVSVDDAVSAVLAKQINVVSDKEEMAIDGVQGESIQLMASIYPVNATVQRVAWEVVSGSEIASISDSGLLTATDNGSVTVRASALDGSGVYAEVQVLATGFSSVEQVESEIRQPRLKAVLVGDVLTVFGIPDEEKATFYVYNTSGCVMSIARVTGATATVDCGNLPTGVYFCRVAMNGRGETLKFYKPER